MNSLNLRGAEMWTPDRSIRKEPFGLVRLTCLSLGAVLLITAGCGNPLPPELRTGSPAPDLRGTSVDGKAISLEDFQGKVVLVDFWGTWCPPCRGAIPHSKQLIESYRDRRFVVLGVGCKDEPRTFKSFLRQESISWPNIFDADGSIADRWMIGAFPTFVLVDHRGTIVGRWEGTGSTDEIDTAIAQAVREAERK